MDTNEFISMAESLPVDLKTNLIDRLLNSLHPSRSEIDALWAKEAERRIEEIQSGKVKSIPGDEVFKEIHDRFSK
ncbi:MAG: addiction module protein [Desulfobacteraceae bacterium]|jgi:putative addiction module component (TIGR02574 family)|nr:addiction module protein [Desulfobacteraceae bacterium]